MKNLHYFTKPTHIHDYVMNRIFKSDEFRRSYDDDGFILRQVNHFANSGPRFFAKTTNDYLERAHFSSWWNVIMLREYDNPVINDLYYLHEMAHVSTMPYLANIGKTAFDDKMQRNELEASVLSEIQVYFELPTLRKNSFDFKIYADRILKSFDIAQLWRTNPNLAIDIIRTMRRDIMVSKNENDMDKIELWIRRFAEQNAAYSITWSNRYLEVENHMAQYIVHAANDPEFAASLHADWLFDMAHPVDQIPFRREAELFAPFYWDNKKRLDEDMKI